VGLLPDRRLRHDRLGADRYLRHEADPGEPVLLPPHDRGGKVQLPWYISIWGQGALDDTTVLRRAIELGGHIKTGLELFYDPDRNPTNLELRQQAQEIAKDVGRPIATHDETRALYKIK